MPFEQNVVVITGASRGIGASLVEGFRNIGYGVVANSRSIDTAGDPNVLIVNGDIAGRDTAESIIDGAVERFGRIDTLVNNADVFIPKQFIDYSEADFATMCAVNLGGLVATLTIPISRVSALAIVGMVKQQARRASIPDVNVEATFQPVARGGALADSFCGACHSKTGTLSLECSIEG